MKKKSCDLQKYYAAWRGKTGPQELLAKFETLEIFRESWKYTQNTSKINPCTVLVQEITNEDHNYCEHCDRNRSDSLPALTRANVSVFFWGLPFHFVSRPARASLVASKKKNADGLDIQSIWVSPSRSQSFGQKIGAASDALLLLCSDWELCSRRLQSARLRHSKQLLGKNCWGKLSLKRNQTHVSRVTACHSSH